MEKSYQHLTLAERIELYRLHRAGCSLRAIATALGRSPGTVSRELKRNSQPTKVWAGGYEPARAQQLAARRRHWDGRFKLARQPTLQIYVRERLIQGWSPEQIAGALRCEAGRCVVSHEAIYRSLGPKGLLAPLAAAS